MSYRYNLSLIAAFFITLFYYSSRGLNFKYQAIPFSGLGLYGHDSDVHLKDFIRSNLDSVNLYPWFESAYKNYNPDKAKVDSLSALRDHISMIVFGGSWCSDTKNLLPKFYKVVEIAKIPAEKITLIGVDRAKHSRDGRSRKYGIKRVPTFILFYDGKETGRVVETVNHSIEADMLNIYHKAGH